MLSTASTPEKPTASARILDLGEKLAQQQAARSLPKPPQESPESFVQSWGNPSTSPQSPPLPRSSRQLADYSTGHSRGHSRGHFEGELAGQLDSSLDRLFPYLQPNSNIQWDPLGVAIAPTPLFSPGMLANAYFFGHPRWGRQYAERAHRNTAFCDRWQAALRQVSPEGWDGQVVVDLGCGAGTLWERLGGEPAEIIGVDLSLGALHWAAADGYAALRADVHYLPLQSECADLVVANALLHHCDQPALVLAEAARLVKPGGLLITDMDPQYSAWQRRGWGLWLHQQQWPNLLDWLRDDLPQADGQIWQRATELHHRQPGQGLQSSLFHGVLAPLGFEVQVYPHHSDHQRGVGAELFQGQWGKASFKTRWEQRLSGMESDRPQAATSLFCLARRSPGPELEPDSDWH